MTRICYDSSLRFHAAARETLDQANTIIAEYQAQGFSMTIRQLHYQFVARKLYENTFKQYKRLIDIISRGRLAGEVDWEAIVDMTRYVRDEYPSPDSEYLPFLKKAAASWKIDWWSDQKYQPIVLIEKDSLVNTIDRKCEEYQVPYLPCRGYTSQSEQWRLGLRLRQLKEDGYTPIIFHFGDHDPSGLDMTRDNEDRLWMFGGFPVELRRLALNMDQIQEYDPPPNPVKPKDARSDNYKEHYGEECWELDALAPPVIASILDKEILSILDMKKFEARKAENDRQTEEITGLVNTLVWPPKPPEEPPEPDPYEWRDPWK